MKRLYIYDPDGTTSEDDELYLIDDGVLTDLMALEANSFRIAPNAFLKAAACGYHVADFYNLNHDGCIMAPKERYLRFGWPEFLAANDMDEARAANSFTYAMSRLDQRRRKSA